MSVIHDAITRAIRWMPARQRERLHFAWRYWRGNTPWDSGQTPPEVVAWATDRPAGRLLDLGCGTGTNVLYFAERGWRATGVDFVPQAIETAKRKRDEQALAADLYVGDVSRLDELPLAPPFDLILDIGCLHSLNDDQQLRYAAHVRSYATSGTTYLLYAALPGPQARPRGISSQRVAELFGPTFTIVDQTTGGDRGGWPRAWYRLVHE